MRIILTAVCLIASSAAAFAQSSTATSGMTAIAKPVAPPVSRTIDQPKSKIPPAARSGESGLRVGEGAATGEPIEIRRMK
jgi:hypothetical protein